ncbi:MAG: ABC transporter permease [Dehalococcoidia bacterium]|nr:ABC transporter permease [Dehalococcoidia bacterium]
MNIWESVRTAWKSIFSNKLRSSLTMLGIIIGVSAVVLMVALGTGFQVSMQQTFENLGASALYVYSSTDKTVKTLRPLTIEDAQALENKALAPAIAVVSPALNAGVSASYGNNNVNVQATGVTPMITQIKSYNLEGGRFISDQDVTARENVVVLGYQTVLDLFGSQAPLGQSIRIGGMKFQVVGFIEKMGGFAGDSYILMPLTTMQSKISGGSSIQQIAVKAVSPDKVDAAIAQITAIMRARHYIAPGAADDFQIRDMREVLESMQDQLAAFSFFLSSVGAISLIVGGIGIMNIMLVSVTERTREIGIRKAIGAKRRDILVQFLIEAATLSLSGGLVGLLLALLLSMGMQNVPMGNLTIAAKISVGVVILALTVSIGIGVISGTYPAFRAAKLDPIESLRHE